MEEREMNSLPDELIVKMAQEGSGSAYEYLIQKYKTLARDKANVYFIVGADRDDVIQEGMIGIFKAVRDFDEKENVTFRTFVELCINRQILSAIKGANRQKHQILNESVSLHVNGESGEGGASLLEQLADKDTDWNPERLTLLKEGAEDLKANGRNLFSNLENQVWNEMLKGRTYREIAEALHKSPKTVDNAMQRIRRKVQGYLGE